MARGIELHAAGQLEQALIAFEQAEALATGDVNTSTAIATVLSALARPRAAYQLLLSIEPQLLASADGATNLAIAAEACGDKAKADTAYQLALKLDPHHLRALNNKGLMEAAESRWTTAIDHARKCVELAPNEPSYHQHLADFLAGAGCLPESLEVLASASRRFPDHLDITVRQIAVLAFDGQFEASRAMEATLDTAQRTYLLEFLTRAVAETDPDHRLVPFSDISADAYQLFTRHAFEAMSICDWRHRNKLADALRRRVADSIHAAKSRDFRDAQFYGSSLDLREDEMAQMREISVAAIADQVKPTLSPFSPRRGAYKRKDDRIHVGLALKNMNHGPTVRALHQQLKLHDRERFAIHLYSSTRRPNLQHKDALAPLAASLVETAHMTHAEAAARIRLDQLDVFVDMAFNSPWCRPEVLALRVAPVQIRQLTWHRHHPPVPCDYNMSDRFIHPDELDLAPYGPVLRLPHTCWLAVHENDSEEPGPLSVPDDFPAGVLVLCSRFSPATLDPETFGAWMEILHALPEAVLYLPGCKPAAAANLEREAAAAGIRTTRLIFEHAIEQASARTRRPDLFLDPFRFSAAEGLEEALRIGVPALSCAGNSMASRMGGSLLHAAGLPRCVLDSRQAYVDEVLRLGRDAQALLQLQEQVRTVTPKSELFDLPSRIRDWENAWAWMTQRSRDGLAPVAFTLPPLSPAPASAAR